MSAKKTNEPDDIPLFELDGINLEELDEKGRQLHSAMEKKWRDAWLKKNDERARKMREERDKELDELRTQLMGAQNELNAYYQWWEREGQYLSPAEQKKAMKEEGLEHPQKTFGEVESLKQEFGKAVNHYNTVIEQLMSRNTTLENAMRLQHDLFDLRFRHPDVDPKRVLETAKERGITSLDLAYELAYGDEIRSKQVEDEVSKRVEEERQRLDAERSISDYTPATTRYAPPAEPTTYADASKGLLQAVRSSDDKGGTIT